MARKRYIWDKEQKKLVPANEYRSSSPSSPYFIQDSMDPTWHPATGEMMTSKHKFREATKAAGCFEVGNEMPYMEKQEQKKREAIGRVTDERELHRDITRTIDEYYRKH